MKRLALRYRVCRALAADVNNSIFSICGELFLFPLKVTYAHSPSHTHMHNADAAEVLRQNRRLFEQNVAKSMRGGYVGSVYFERCLK